MSHSLCRPNARNRTRLAVESLEDRRLLATFALIEDGTVSDTNRDGLYETASSTGVGLSIVYFSPAVTTANNSKAILEFNTYSVQAGMPITSAYLRFQQTTITSNPGRLIQVVGYAGDGVVRTSDANASGVVLATYDSVALGGGEKRVPLDTAALANLLAYSKVTIRLQAIDSTTINAIGSLEFGTLRAFLDVNFAAENSPPSASSDQGTTWQAEPVTLNVIANDVDPDGDALRVVSFERVSGGTVTLNGDGTVRFQPNLGYVGLASFIYTVADSNGNLDVASVFVNVLPNNAPVASPDSAATEQDQSVVINVLANDRDADGDPISVVSITNPAHGTATLRADGTILYTPMAGYYGNDRFEYMIQDTSGATSFAYVNITVTQKIIAASVTSKITSINLSTSGKLTFAILSDASLTASTINVSSVRLGSSSAIAKGRLRDIDSDGDLDLELTFDLADVRNALLNQYETLLRNDLLDGTLNSNRQRASLSITGTAADKAFAGLVSTELFLSGKDLERFRRERGI